MAAGWEEGSKRINAETWWLSHSISPQLFQRVARQAEHREDLITGIEAFLDELIVLPPGKWDLSTRIPPPSHLPSPRRRWAGGRASQPPASPCAGSCRDTSACDIGTSISVGMKLPRSRGVLPAKPLHTSLLWSLLLLVLSHLAVDGKSPPRALQRERMGTLGFSTWM